MSSNAFKHAEATRRPRRGSFRDLFTRALCKKKKKRKQNKKKKDKQKKQASKLPKAQTGRRRVPFVRLVHHFLSRRRRSLRVSSTTPSTTTLMRTLFLLFCAPFNGSQSIERWVIHVQDQEEDKKNATCTWPANQTQETTWDSLPTLVPHIFKTHKKNKKKNKKFFFFFLCTLSLYPPLFFGFVSLLCTRNYRERENLYNIGESTTRPPSFRLVIIHVAE